MAQAGTVYRYFRVDADHDISGDALDVSLDDGVTWLSGLMTYIATASLPPRVAAVNAETPPEAGLTGYWFRVLTGPATTVPLAETKVIRGKLTDSPETPHFAWYVKVLDSE